MGVKGTGLYPQGAKYSFTRSYIGRVAISDTGIVVHQAANVFTLTAASFPGAVFTVIFRGEFFVWNSNQYTLDFIINDSYYTVSPSPTKIPLDFAIVLVFAQGGHAPFLQYCPGNFFLTPIFGTLPSQPDGYWLPKELHA